MTAKECGFVVGVRKKVCTWAPQNVGLNRKMTKIAKHNIIVQR